MSNTIKNSVGGFSFKGDRSITRAGNPPLNDREKVGALMQQWHSSMGDPIYAVGSFYFANDAYPEKEVVEAARDSLLTMLDRAKRGEAGWGKNEVMQLAVILSYLDHALVEDYKGAGHASGFAKGGTIHKTHEPKSSRGPSSRRAGLAAGDAKAHLGRSEAWRRAVRAEAGAEPSARIDVVSGGAAPRVEGETSYHSNKSGTRIDHPNAYRKKGFNMVYHPSTRRVVVGADWKPAGFASGTKGDVKALVAQANNGKTRQLRDSAKRQLKAAGVTLVRGQYGRKIGLVPAGFASGATHNARLFIGVYPGGISYADRTVEEHGDYKKLAFLPYDTLALDLKPGVSAALAKAIKAHAATLQARKGRHFAIDASGHHVVLGKSAKGHASGTRGTRVATRGTKSHYRRARAADPWVGGWLRGEITTNYKALESVLGKPMRGEYDSAKSVAGWRVVDVHDPRKQFTVYEWKNSRRSGYGGDLTRAEIFSNLDLAWHIGSEAEAKDVAVFADWLAEKTGGTLNVGGKGHASGSKNGLASGKKSARTKAKKTRMKASCSCSATVVRRKVSRKSSKKK